jgi:DNA-binding protein
MIQEERIVFVGGKPFMNYVTAVVMQFTTNGAESVIVRSRGKFISRAVDVAEMVRSKFLTDSIKIGEVVIAAEDFKNKEGRPIRVSTIDIHLDKLNGVKPTPTNFEIRPKKQEETKSEPEAPVEEKKEEVKETEKEEETPAEETEKEEPAVEETPKDEVPTETAEETPEEVTEPEVKEEPVAEETQTEPAVEETPSETEQTNLTPEILK